MLATKIQMISTSEAISYKLQVTNYKLQGDRDLARTQMISTSEASIGRRGRWIGC